MSLQDFVEKSRRQYKRQGLSVLPAITSDFVFSAMSRVPVLPRLGTNIFDRDWDVLLILDACRLDQFRRVVDEEADSIWSVGSSSNEWMDHTFSHPATQETAYVTGNPFTNEHDSVQFAALDELWETHWDDKNDTMPPEPISRHVISRHREGYERVVGHYMQPHYPFIGKNTEVTGRGMGWEMVNEDADTDNLALWDQFLYGVRNDIDEVWDAYDDNLRYVWSEVERVTSNVSGTVVVTADHGNALGEFGMWGHKPGMPHPKMRRVPWVEFECEDSGDEVEAETGTEVTDNVSERLEVLGYK